MIAHPPHRRLYLFFSGRNKNFPPQQKNCQFPAGTTFPPQQKNAKKTNTTPQLYGMIPNLFPARTKNCTTGEKVPPAHAKRGQVPPAHAKRVYFSVCLSARPSGI
jgi:hypothetical protein